MRSWRRVAIRDTELEVSDWGSGEPVVFAQTALTADELLPLAETPHLDDGYHKVVYHRRGYAGSAPVSGPGSIVRDAADCRVLFDALGIDRAHVVGVSYSGAVALQFATDAPERTHTLTVIEPPPTHTPSAPKFRAANERLLRTRLERGPEAALDELLTTVIGSDWQKVTEDHVPGSAAQMLRDTGTFFDVDLPALLGWRYGPADASRISCPLLHIGGNNSGRFFAEVRELILGWLPHAEDVMIDGADHALALTHTSQVADALSDFLGRHPMRSA